MASSSALTIRVPPDSLAQPNGYIAAAFTGTAPASAASSPFASPKNGQTLHHLSMDLYGQSWADKRASATLPCPEAEITLASSLSATGSRNRRRQGTTSVTSNGFGTAVSSSARCSRRVRAEGLLSLNVSSNRLSLTRLLELVEALPCDRLTELNASQNDFGDASLGPLLRCLPVLRVLRVSGCGLGPDGVHSLASELLSASEECAKAEFDGEVHLTSPSSAAATNGTTSRSWQQSGLQVLDVSGSSLEAAVPTLGNYLACAGCTLRSLDLSYSALGPEAVRVLSEALRANSTLQVLRLAHCHLRDEAAVLLASFSAEDSCLPLRSLCLARNQLPENSCKELGFFLVSSVGRRLEELDISGNGLSEEASSRALGRALVSIGSAEGAAESRFDLSGTRPFFNPVNGRWDTTPQLLPALRAPGCRVMEVAFDQCSISEAAIPTLARICLNVRSFSFCGHSHGETFSHNFAELAHAAAERAEQRMERQRRCNSSAAVEEEGFQDSIANTSISPVSRQQRGLRLCLRELRLNDAALQDNSVVLLAEALQKLRAVRRDHWDLEVLEVAGNHLSVESIDALAPILVENDRLRRLVLSRNRLRHVGGARLGEFLPWRGACAPLELELRRCSLTAEGVLQVWMGVLSEGGRVAAIDLTENAVDNDCLEALQAAMSTSRPPWLSLRKVQLLPNPCSGLAVAQLLTQSAPWQRLNLTDLAVDAPLIAQLLYCLGSDQPAEVVSPSTSPQVSPRGSPQPSPRGSLLSSPRSCDSARELSTKCTSDFSLSLSGSSIVSKQWQWGIVTDAVRTALASTGASKSEVARNWASRVSGTSWRRFGGCGGSLLLELDRCELSRAAFKVPCTMTPAAPPATCAATISSLARSARREIRARSSSCSRTARRAHSEAAACMQQHSLAARARGAGVPGVSSSDKEDHSAVVADVGGPLILSDVPAASSDRSSQCPAAEALSSQGADLADTRSVRRSNSVGVYSGNNRTGMLPSSAPSTGSQRSRSGASRALGWAVPMALPPGVDPPQQQAWNGFNTLRATGSIGRAFERHGQLEIEVSTVLRELRGIESLCLDKCGLTDRWLMQLCTSGGSSKWSGVRLLDLRHNELTPACCPAIASVVAGGLEVLIVDGNRLEASGLETLCAAVRPGGRCSLRWLSAAENGIGHPGGFVAAELLGRPGGCPLQGLSLARNPRLSSGELVAVLRGLCRQAASQNSIEGDKEQLGRRLEVLDLSACGADSSVVPQLAKALTQCPNLSVDLRGCPLAGQGSRGTNGQAPGGNGRSNSSKKVAQHAGTAGVGANVLRDLDKFVSEGRVQL